MDADTPITLAAARYSNRDAAVEGFDMVGDAHKLGEFDHTAVAVLTRDDSGKLQVERHDTTAKNMAWVGAAKTKVVQTTWGDLGAEIDSEIAKAQERLGSS